MVRAVSHMALVAALLVLATGVAPVLGVKRRSQRQRREVAQQFGPTDEQIWDSGLMEKKLAYATLLEKGHEYYDDVSAKRFKGFVLGYVTPWNRAGYQNAVTFRKKLDAVAPVWFQIRRQKGDDKPTITGGHEFNQTWVDELRQDGEGTGPLLVPRFIMEMDPEQHVASLQDPTELLKAIATQVLGYKLDGIVLETWAAWGAFNGLSNESFKKAAFVMIKALAELFKANGGKKLFLAVPPLYPANEKSPWMERDDLLELAEHVDGFSLMTYDHNMATGASGPNAPLPWMKGSYMILDKGPEEASPMLPEGVRGKVLLGTNFYGWDFALSTSAKRGGQGLSAVTANDVAGLLQRHQPELEWDEVAEEHSFGYTDKEGVKHEVWLPTPRSLEMRLQAAQDWGLGFSIWELGQGWERFFELL